MKDSTLMKFAIAWAMIGATMLFFFAEISTAEEINGTIDDYYGKEIAISGEIIKISPREKVTFLDVETPWETVKVVTFDKLELNGTKVRVQGKVDIYRGNFEIIASRIWCEDC
tara:strand:+ start:156 stop:494 length:339 start_codon:yes stop_codon:yes gene_type:complete